MSFKFKGSGTGGGLYAGTSVQGVDTSAPAANTGEVQAHAPNEQVSQPAASQSSNWSAALGFAPMPRRKPTASAKPKPSAQSTALAVAAAAPVLFTANDPALQPTSGNAEPSSYTNIPLPPQSLDDDDINGFRKTEAGQKAAKKAKKRKGKQQSQQDPSRDWLAEYHPAKPNDYTEYKAYAKRKRDQKIEAQRQKELQDSIQAAAALADSEDDDEADSDDSEDRDRAFKAKAAQFAPPKSYSEEPVPPPSMPVRTQESGEDAYARRLAMSQQQQETGQDAYARRIAMSQQSLPAPPVLETPQPAPHHQPPPDMPPPPPTIAPPVDATDKVAQAQAKAKAIAEKLGKLGANVPNPPTSQPEASGSAQPSQATAPPKRPREDDEDEGDRPNPHAFAQRLMSKYGWKKGQGLGAQEDGMVKALHVKDTKTAAQHQDIKNADGSTSTGPVGRRGFIVSETKDAKDKSDREKFGEPSKIVVLTNLVGRSEVDDDLPNEIAEEANKCGIVEKCFIHVMPFNTAAEEEVRIFLIFSGMVGAWKAVKDFEGRFFNGRTVRARFFSEVWAERKIWGMSF